MNGPSSCNLVWILNFQLIKLYIIFIIFYIIKKILELNLALFYLDINIRVVIFSHSLFSYQYLTTSFLLCIFFLLMYSFYLSFYILITSVTLYIYPSFLFPFSFISAVNLAHNSYEMWDYYIVSLMYRIVRFQSRDANCNNPIGTRGEEKVKNKQFLSSTRLNGASSLYSPTMYAHYASIEGSFFISSIKQITTPSMTHSQSN